jgi:PEP-CTERM motif
MKASFGRVAWLSMVVVMLVCTQSLYANSVYDVVTGFSNASNPNGVWIYEYNGTEYTGSQAVSNFVGTGLPGWWTAQPIPNSLIVLQNVTGSTVSFLTIRDPTNTLWMDPEGGNVSVVFTAPSAGTYTVTGAFLGIDTFENSHPVEIILGNGSIVWKGTISSFGGKDSFSFSETLNTGGTVTFLVGTGSTGCSYCDLSTGLNATITSGNVTTTPEPGTLILLGSGLLSLGPILRRRRLTRIVALGGRSLKGN